jgi:pilus assembly protein CpaE
MQVVIASDSEAVADAVRRFLLRAGRDCPLTQVLPLDAAGAKLRTMSADLVVLAMSPSPERSLNSLRELRPLTTARIIAVGPAADSKLVLAALRGGGDDYVDEQALETELAAALVRVPIAIGSRTQPGRVVAVVGPSGGAGSSTLAVNVATVLAQEHEAASLFDLKLASGDLAALLNLKPVHTLADVCQNIERLDHAMFERCLVRHESGVHLLAAPSRFTEISAVTAPGVQQALAIARNLFPYVVLDVEHNFREEEGQLLRQADVILLVLRLDFNAVNNTKRTLEFLERSGISSERVHLVVNRHGQAKEVPAAKAEQVLGVKIFHYVPDDPKTINRANNNGVPAVLEAPTAKVCKSVTRLAVSVNGRHPGR